LELPSSSLTGEVTDLWHLNDLGRFAARHVHFAPGKSDDESEDDDSVAEPSTMVAPPLPAQQDRKLRDVFKLSQADNLCASDWITCNTDGTLHIGRKDSHTAGLSNPSDCSLIQVNLNDFEDTPMTLVTGLVFDDVYMCQPSGALSALKSFPNLKVFRVNRGNQLVGEIRQLQLAPQLKELSFRGSPAEGRVEDLEGLRHLEKLTLSFSSIHGKLEALQFLPELRYLKITDLESMGPGISGDLLDLQSLVQLEQIELSEIGGNLYGLRNMKYLKKVVVKAEVVGFLADLMPLAELKYLDLAHGQVIGSLDDVKVLGKLQHLSLGQFNPLEGNLAQLVQMTNLREYNVRTTKLLGYYDDFKKFRLLQDFKADHLDLW